MRNSRRRVIARDHAPAAGRPRVAAASGARMRKPAHPRTPSTSGAAPANGAPRIEERIASCTTLIDSGRYQGINLAILHDNRGMALRAQGDLAGALKDFTEAISLDPNSARAFANHGSALFAQRDFDGAIADFDQAIKLDPNDASAFMKRGSAYEAKGDFDQRHRKL